MSGTTANRGYPYPQLSDNNNPPADIQALAEALDTDVDALAEPPMCVLVQQTAQSGWTADTLTGVTFGTGSTVVDHLSIHSESSNTSRLVIGKKLGWWEVSGIYCPLTNSSSTRWRATIGKNGTAINGTFVGNAPGSSQFEGLKTSFPVLATLSTDYVELLGLMGGTGSFGTQVSSPYVACSLSAIWKRPA